MTALLHIWLTMPLPERIGAVLFAVLFPLLALGIALVLP